MKPSIYRALATSRVSRLVLVLCLILVSIVIQARELREQEVRAAVQTWLRHVTADARPGAVIERMEPYEVEGKTVAYIAHIMGGGYCLCSADDVVLPVYFYSPKGTYNGSNPNLQAILWEIGERTKILKEAVTTRSQTWQDHQDSLADRASFWRDLIAGDVPPRGEGLQAEPDRMELPFTPIWGQNSPYNDQCPDLTPNERTVVGCAATAASQIMYYWKWPKTGVGNKSVIYHWRWRNTWDEEPLATNPNIPANYGGRLQWTPANGGRLRMNGFWDDSVYYAGARNISTEPVYLTALENLWNRLTPGTTVNSANFGATTYNWSLLRDQHTNPVDAGDVEVAKLCYHVAIAVDTGFGIWLSSSDNYRVPDPLRDYFRYDPDVTYGPPDVDEMTEEIQWLRPIGFSGGPPGHVWVIYGYNKGTDQFKMNMGWDGNSDDWYTLDNIPRGINQNHKQLIRIAPLDVVKFVADRPPVRYPDPGSGSPGLPYNHIEEALSYVADGTTLIFKAGSVNTFSSNSLVIDRPMTLKGYNITIQRQQ